MALPRERRANARIAVPINVRVVVGMKELELQVRDVSRCGIFLYTKDPPAGVGAELTLKLALTAGIKPLTLKAEIIRIVMAPEDKGGGVLGMALQFLHSEKEKEAHLLELLDRAMLGRGTQMRTYPRVYRLIEVTCKTRTEAKALIGDIGEGGVGLMLEQDLPVNEEVTIEITRLDAPSLKLQGWVVSSVPVEEKPGAFKVGLRFGRIPPNMRRELQLYLKKLYRG